MFKKLKKEIDELKKSKGHIEKEPIITKDPAINFNELIQLSKRTNFPFKIIGNQSNFKLNPSKKDSYFIGIISLTFSILSLIGLIYNTDDKVFWIITPIILIASSYFTLFFPIAKQLQIDLDSNKIIYSTNNVLQRPLKSKPFQLNDFKKFSSKKASIHGSGMNNHYHKIYLHLNNEKLHLTDLIHGPIYFINPNIFITSLTQLIKNGA